MKFRTYDEGGDTQLFVTTTEQGNIVVENEFVFTGFGNGIHPYHRKRINRIVSILKSNGIVLNIAEVSSVNKMADDIDGGDIKYNDLKIPKGFDIKSEDGNTYILFQDTEMGRGWALFIKNEDIILQDHRDSVLDELEKGKFIRSLGIDYKVERVKDLEKLKKKLSNN